MASTSPDGIRSPDQGDPFNISTDLAIMANDVQDTFNRRGNLYRGTSSERVSFSAPEGALWSDTDGDGILWVRRGPNWVRLTPDTGWVSVALSGGWTAPETFQMRQIGSVVYSKGKILNSSFESTTYTEIGTVPTAIDAPPSEVIVRAGGNSGTLMTFRVLPNRSIQVWRNTTSAAHWGVTPISYVSD